MRSLNVGATGMVAQQMHIEVISNNIANMTTTGYKRRRPEFHDLLYQNHRRQGSAASENGEIVPAGIQMGLGVKPAAVYRIHDQGDLLSTENQLDLAIQGDGFFVVDTPDGDLAYTRSGNLQLSPTGQIVTQDGFPVSPGITIPDDAISVTINADGELFATIANQINEQNLGQLEIANFINPAGLDAIGNNLFMETEASGPAIVGTAGQDGAGSVLQGFLESSNVNPVLEITALITAQRAYDMNSKVIQASDEMMSTTTNMR